MTESINTIEKDNALHIVPTESMVASTVEEMRKEILEIVEKSEESIVLDLSKIEVADSLGVSLIVGIFKACKAKELEYKVIGANKNILKVFYLFNLNKHFTVEGR